MWDMYGFSEIVLKFDRFINNCTGNVSERIVEVIIDCKQVSAYLIMINNNKRRAVWCLGFVSVINHAK